MLKIRLVGVLVIKDGTVVQSIGFKNYLPVGTPAIAVDYLNKWGIDEITMLEIDAARGGRGPNIDNISACAPYCQVPLAVGGGITSLNHMKEVIHAGADKVVVNSRAVQYPNLISEGAKLFGEQCIVFSMDAKQSNQGKYEVFIDAGVTPTGFGPVHLAKMAEKYGAGEILLNSIDRDGSKTGYDLELIQQVVDAVNIPVIVCGGAGHPQHFLEAMQLDVSAVAAANFFHFSEHSVTTAKSYLKKYGGNIRLDSYVNYLNIDHDFLGRVAKIDDQVLEKLRFEYIPEEVI